MYFFAFVLIGVLIYSISQMVSKEDRRLKLQKARVALTGAQTAPTPLVVEQTKTDSIVNFEECLARKLDTDPLWITSDYDLTNGHFQAHAYVYRAGGRNSAPSENYVYLDASFVFNEETSETKITWSFSVKATKAFPDSRGDITEVQDTMAQATNRIREKFGAPILAD